MAGNTEVNVDVNPELEVPPEIMREIQKMLNKGVPIEEILSQMSDQQREFLQSQVQNQKDLETSLREVVKQHTESFAKEEEKVLHEMIRSNPDKANDLRNMIMDKAQGAEESKAAVQFWGELKNLTQSRELTPEFTKEIIEQTFDRSRKAADAANLHHGNYEKSGGNIRTTEKGLEKAYRMNESYDRKQQELQDQQQENAAFQRKMGVEQETRQEDAADLQRREQAGEIDANEAGEENAKEQEKLTREKEELTEEELETEEAEEHAAKAKARTAKKGTKVSVKTTTSNPPPSGSRPQAQGMMGNMASAAQSKAKGFFSHFIPTDPWDWFVLAAILIHVLDGYLFGWDYSYKGLQLIHFTFILLLWMFVSVREGLHQGVGSVASMIFLGIAVFNGNAYQSWLAFVVVALVANLLSPKPNNILLLMLFGGVLWADLFALSLIFTYLIPLGWLRFLTDTPVFTLLTNRLLFPILALFTLFFAYAKRKTGFTATITILFILFWVFAAFPDVTGNLLASKIVTPEHAQQARDVLQKVATTTNELVPVRTGWTCSKYMFSSTLNPMRFMSSSPDSLLESDITWDKCMRGMPLSPGTVIGETVRYRENVWSWDGKTWKEGPLIDDKVIDSDTLDGATPFRLSFAKPEQIAHIYDNEYAALFEIKEMPDEEYLPENLFLSANGTGTMDLVAECTLLDEGTELPLEVSIPDPSVQYEQVTYLDETFNGIATLSDIVNNRRGRQATVYCAYQQDELSGKKAEIKMQVTLTNVRFRSVYYVMFTHLDAFDAWKDQYEGKYPEKVTDTRSYYRTLYVEQFGDPASFDEYFPKSKIVPLSTPSGIEFAMKPYNFLDQPIVGLADGGATVSLLIEKTKEKDNYWQGLGKFEDAVDVRMNDVFFKVRNNFVPMDGRCDFECEDVDDYYQVCRLNYPEQYSWNKLKDGDPIPCDMELPQGSLTNFLGFDLQRSDVHTASFELQVLADVTFTHTISIDFSDDDVVEYTKRLDAFPVSGITSSDVNTAIISVFGDDRDGGARTHRGIDIVAPEGTDLIATVSGSVYSAGCNDLGGNYITIIDEDDFFQHYYAHIHNVAINPETNQPFKKGDKVIGGQSVIGTVGTTIHCFNNVACRNNQNKCAESCTTQMCENLMNQATVRKWQPWEASQCVEDHCGVPGQTVAHLHYAVINKAGKYLDPEKALRNYFNYGGTIA